ncbi:MAG: hypothetical protein IPG89_10880 [Bacteroidetes bacterium]|nr:hypothetical protein [Bacteroidota bacterium]
MKNLLFIFLLIISISAYSQNDSISNIRKAEDKKFGLSIFGGLGVGGNDLGYSPMLKGGYAKTISSRFYYGMHTINVHVSQVTSMDQAIFNRVDPSTELNMRNLGLTYGLGSYGKHFSAGFLFGVSYTNLIVPAENAFMLDFAPKVYYKEKYNIVNACFGLHTSVKTKHIGIGYQIYYNFGLVTSVNATIGVEVGL